MRTPFGYDPFADIPDTIVVEMRKAADQTVRPIFFGQSDLFARCKFQTAVCTEMDQSIRFKPFLDP